MIFSSPLILLKGKKKQTVGLLNNSLIPNTILTLMYNIFKVREEETLYKPRSVQSWNIKETSKPMNWALMTIINGKYKNKPTG